MKRHVQETGIRKWSGTDLVELQSEAFKVLDGFLGDFGPMIVSGCEITGNTVAPGLVVLPETAEGITTHKLATFKGGTVTAFPAYLKLQKTTITREYVNTGTQPVAYEYEAVLSKTAITGTEGLMICETGNRAFTDAIQDGEHRFVTDKEKEAWNNKKAECGNLFALFDGFVENGIVIPGKDSSDTTGKIVFLRSKKIFVKKVSPRLGMIGMVVYFTDWNGREEYTALSSTATETREYAPLSNKFYLHQGSIYYWNGEELEKIGGSGGDNYEALKNKPKINGVELEGDLSLEDLGIKNTLAFVEIVESGTVNMLETAKEGEIVFVKSANTFALRVNNRITIPGGERVQYYANWPERYAYTEFFTPEGNGAKTTTRPYKGTVYSIGQLKYYWEGEGLTQVGPKGEKGTDGITWRPLVDTLGKLTWEKDTIGTKPLEVNIMGPAGFTWRPSVNDDGVITWEHSLDTQRPKDANIKGATWQPFVSSEGLLSWTKNAVDAEPAEVNIKGRTPLVDIGSDYKLVVDGVSIGKPLKGDDAVVVEIFSSNGNVFRNNQGGTTLTVQVRKGETDITSEVPANRFAWEKKSNNPDTDRIFNQTHMGYGPKLELTPDDVWSKAIFNCIVTL